MSTFEDLSAYVYWPRERMEQDIHEEAEQARLAAAAGEVPIRFRLSMADKNIGWLGAEPDFETGPVDPAFGRALDICADFPVNVTRGPHYCQLCPSPADDSAEADFDHIPAGNAEIHVKGPDGIVYGAPGLIVHYIDEHHYRPPQVFIDAVMAQAERLKNEN